MSLQGRHILITGAGRGIGAATAELAASRGASLALLSRTQSELAETVARITKRYSGTKIFFESIDVRDEAALCKFCERADRAIGGLDGLVNNAALYCSSSIVETSQELLREAFETNLFSAFYLSREIMKRLISRRVAGSIVNVGSLAGLSGYQKFSGSAVYSATKYALIGLTEVLATEGQPHGIRANLVAPGATDTKMLRSAFPEFKANLKPEDIAKVICFYLDQDESHQISGTTMGVPN